MNSLELSIESLITALEAMGKDNLSTDVLNALQSVYDTL